jgi:PTH2 family peptidyl-tRNA hydrolase
MSYSFKMSSWVPEGREHPSTAEIATAIALLAGTIGFFIGQASSIGLFGASKSPSSSSTKSRNKKKSQGWPNNYDVTIHPDSSDEELMKHLNGGQASRKKREVADSEEDDDDAEGEEDDTEESESDSPQSDLPTFMNSTEELKLVLCVRTDLGMGKGKIAAQASHATLANYTHLLHNQHPSPSPLLQRWARHGQAKIALQVHSEEQLLELQAKAVSLGLCARVVRDAGRTQIRAGEATVLGVGPGPKGVVDVVTGGLKLL